MESDSDQLLANPDQPERILVVDDDEGIRRILTTFLERRHFRVSQAHDGSEALELLDQESFELVITDVVMPNVSGIDLLAKVTEHHPKLPLIMITGRPALDAAVECMKSGAFDYITKPFDFGKIETVVGRALKEGKRRREDTPLDRLRSHFLGHYDIERVLGEGNVGIVLLARHHETPDAQPVALKLLKQGFIAENERHNVVERFLAEATITASIRHRNVIAILDFGFIPDEDIPYIVMEYFPGQALTTHIENRNRLDLRQRTEIIRQIADALTAIHGKGIYHRDIKPHNILINSELQVKVTDFGVARSPASHLTVEHEIIGSPAYISPEGFSQSNVDHRSDIFSLGVLAYELYLGQRPFQGQSLPHFAHLIQHERPTEPRRLDPKFPPELQIILARMLKKDPEDRYPNAAAVVADLDDWLGGKQHNKFLQTLTHRLAFDWR